MQMPERIKEKPESSRLVFDNILFATDLSVASEVNLHYAITLARQYHGKIYIVPAIDMDAISAIGDSARQEALHKARTRVSDWAERGPISNQLCYVRHEIFVGQESERAVARLVEQQAFDLAVNGVAFRPGEAVVLEPTLEEAVRRTRCPVMTAGSDVQATNDGKVQTFVYGADFSPESLEASRYAISLAQEFQARLILLHVVEGAEPTMLGDRERAARPYALWLSKLVPDEARLWSELEFAVEFGRPAERILQVAWESHATLIVLGAHGLERLVTPGRNVRQVMCNSWCPVITVRGTLEGEKQERFWRAAQAASTRVV
jgi:nucleotide-binding universal stress UspA family protein